MKAWFDELIDGIYRGLFALVVLFIPTIALGEVVKALFPSDYHSWTFFSLICAYFLLLYRLRHRFPYLRDEESHDS